MMDQYRRIRNDLPPDTFLFFRLGDFYEMFFDDAKEASQLLNLTLTKRHDVPMCGVPHHAADFYLAKLIRRGKKVAICEQMEDPALAKGIVRREVTRVVTPGTLLEDNLLESKRNNYIAGLAHNGKIFGIAFLDLSTGAFWMEESDDAVAIEDNLARYAPTECVVPADRMNDPLFKDFFRAGGLTVVTAHDDWTFDRDAAHDLLLRHFKVHSLDGFGVGEVSAGLGAAGAVLHYVTQALKRQIDHVRRIQVKNPASFMLLDEATISNLDLADDTGAKKGVTLLGVLDSTKTSMGARLLREWLMRPLTNFEAINARHGAVEALTKDRKMLLDLREVLTEIKDLERLISRLNAGTGNARDVRALGRSLENLPRVREIIGAPQVELLALLNESIEPLPEIAALIDRAIVDEPPVPIKDGGLLKKGYHAELDELKDAANSGKQWIADYQTREQERTGIKSLKVRHNNVFGYYIEITKSNLAAAPADYIRKQTIVNGERFITPELKEYENKIFGAEERSVALEYELFLEIREKIVAHTESIQRTAAAIAQLDALSSLAERALALRYARPQMSDDAHLKIKDGRHPVIESLPQAERFVPNDALLDGDKNQIMMITGPNMAGKSTYIRQVAIIVIMAQMGSFVPADAAEIGICDRVFTRVGASDDLARGRSTFMVEMQETANILNNATPRSLIVLDEIGRGTSTFDGISIAWAVAEFLHNNAATKAKTLFATHYHELTDLALTLPGVKNYNVLVKESGDRIAFLRRIVPGAADKSYGIAVARLVGLPPDVISRAKEILTNLEDSEFDAPGMPKLAQHRAKKTKENDKQLSLFGA